jgi:L-seryl-tRNA(Ser) seleniumtransferase
LRVDKTTLAALQATLHHYLLGEATDKVPVWRMIRQTSEGLLQRALNWVQELQARGVACEVAPGRSAVGGGSLPGETLPTHLVALGTESPDRMASRLRAGTPPLITRIEEGRLVLDPRTVLPEQEPRLWSLVAAASR